MLKQTAVDHYKSASNVAKALNISPAAVSKWGAVVPWFSAGELERLNHGVLRRIDDLYVRGRPRDLTDTALPRSAA